MHAARPAQINDQMLCVVMTQPSLIRQPRSGALLKGKTTAFAVYVCGAGLAYLSQLVLARVIGMAAYGIYAYVISIVTLLAYLAALGFDVSLLRFLPTYKSHEQWGLMRGVVHYAEQNALRAGGLIATLGFLVVMASGYAPHHGMSLTFAAGFCLVPVYALLWIRCARVRAFGGVASALIPDRVVRDGFVLAVILAAATLLPAGTFGAPAAMAVTLMGGIAGLATITRATRKLQPIAHEPIRFDPVPWRRSIFSLVAIALAEVAMNRAGTLALTWAGNSSNAGAYALAFNLSAIVILPRVAVNTQFAPMVADRFARGDMQGVQVLLNHASFWATLAATGIAGVLWLAGKPLLPYAFGPAVTDALPVLSILLVGQIIASGAGSQIYLLTMSGQEKLAAIILTGFALADLAASVLLVAPFGPPGAAVATSACLIGVNMAMALLAWQRLNVRPAWLGLLGTPCRAVVMTACLASARAVLTQAAGWVDRRKPDSVEVPAKRGSMQ